MLAEVAADAARDSGGVPAELLGDFLAALVAAVGRRRAHRRRPGCAPTARSATAPRGRASRCGPCSTCTCPPPGGCGATCRRWPTPPGTPSASSSPARSCCTPPTTSSPRWPRATSSPAARWCARRSRARREFIDDLLNGATDVVGRAAPRGRVRARPVRPARRRHGRGRARVRRRQPAGRDARARHPRHQGRRAGAARQQGGPAGRRVRRARPGGRRARHRAGSAATLGQARGGRASVGPGGSGWAARPSAPTACSRPTASRWTRSSSPTASGWTSPLVDARDLLVYRMLLRDRAALGDLVESTLGGAARGPRRRRAAAADPGRVVRRRRQQRRRGPGAAPVGPGRDLPAGAGARPHRARPRRRPRTASRCRSRCSGPGCWTGPQPTHRPDAHLAGIRQASSAEAPSFFDLSLRHSPQQT